MAADAAPVRLDGPSPPNGLVPFDIDTVAESLRKTSRPLVVQEGPAAGGWGATLIARISAEYFATLDAPRRC